MAFNGSGVHNRVHDWTTDLAGAVPVTASRMDAEHDDMSTALSNTICRDGQSTTTARIPFAAGLSAAAGTTASVAYAQTNDNNTGLYFPATDQWGLVAGGTETLSSTATKITAQVAVDFDGAVAPTSSDGAALGSTTQMWSDLFLASGAVINFNNGNATMTHAAGSLTTAVTTFAITGALTVSTTAAITGNATFGGTLGVTGATTLSSTLAVTGNVAVNTDKFTVTAASGNTAVAGTLAVTGASTLTGAVGVTGALTANNAAGIAGRNTAKAFVAFTTDGSSVVTVTGSLNVTSVATASVGGSNGFRVTFTNALPSANYTVAQSAGMETTLIQSCQITSRASDRTTTTFDFVFLNNSTGVVRANVNCSIAFFDNG